LPGHTSRQRGHRHLFATSGSPDRLKISSLNRTDAGERFVIMSAPKSPTIAFVIPCYNEQAGIQHTLSCLLTDIARLEKSKAISAKSYVLLIDDGSTGPNLGSD
jgi:cellulose synthase/poly-beta-1,6-N-acetylglucosamine synthase-like glycosyltransferase